MRVIAGERRRYLLKTPKNTKIRPTSDKIKETLFNMLSNKVYDAVFIDLFSGTGQIGIEALSRGAKFCVFIDRDKTAISLIKENISHVKYEAFSDIIHGNLPDSIVRIDRFNPEIIFLDPPYDSGLYKASLSKIAGLNSIDENTLIIAESDAKEDFSYVTQYGLYIEKEKIYKTSKHVFMRKNYE